MTHAVGGGGAERLGELVDVLFLTNADNYAPSEIFARLRWGGELVFVSRDLHALTAAAKELTSWHPEHSTGLRSGGGAWIVEQPIVMVKKYCLGLRFLRLHKKIYYFVMRKMMLVEPGRSSDRFTYHVYLARNPESRARGNDAYQVVKEVPTVERVLNRLKEKFPDADTETLRRRARKFTEKIFPVFLTRETAILKLLQRDLPPQFRERVPRVLSIDQDSLGYTRVLRLNWLRNGGKPISQLEFARQSAELLTALHDKARVMHLDLRLDNFVVTPRGVGFVDFGSAVRVGENFPEASLLSNLFGEMMRTSQIQRMLGHMSQTGQVTSEEIRASYHRIDKAVDFFYLAVQINAPHTNPDFKGLIRYDKTSREAKALETLTNEILRPTDPANPRFKSAGDILQGILEIKS